VATAAAEALSPRRNLSVRCIGPERRIFRAAFRRRPRACRPSFLGLPSSLVATHFVQWGAQKLSRFYFLRVGFSFLSAYCPSFSLVRWLPTIPLFWCACVETSTTTTTAAAAAARHAGRLPGRFELNASARFSTFVMKRYAPVEEGDSALVWTTLTPFRLFHSQSDSFVQVRVCAGDVSI